MSGAVSSQTGRRPLSTARGSSALAVATPMRNWISAANGKRLGRDFKLTGHQRRAVIHRLDAGDGHREITRHFGVSHQTIGRIAQRHAVAA